MAKVTEARFDELVKEFRDFHEVYLEPANKAESIADYIGRDFGESYRRKGDSDGHVLGRSRRMKLKWDRQIEDSETSADDWDAISLVVQRLLRGHEPLPEVLADWVADVVEDVSKKMDDKKRARPTKRGVRQKNYRRDENIRAWIDFEITTGALGINATRNVAKEGEEPCVEGNSLCDVVGVALNNIRLESSPNLKPLKYDAIEKVWTNRRWK